MKPTPNPLRRLPALLAAGALLLSLAPAFAATAADPAYVQKIEAVRKERIDDLKKEDSWLTLVGLFWLDEGENRFGSDPGTNKVIFPEGKGPAVAGVLIREGDKVRVRAAPGAGVTSDGKPVTELALVSDAKGKPTVLDLGTLSFFVIERGDRIGVRVKDKASPLRTSFHGLDFYPIQPEWRFDARFEPYNPPKKVPIPNVLGQVSESDSPGAVVFDWQGKTYRLDVLGSEKDGLSTIFADTTNGHETYGAGRFLELGKLANGKVEVDFNTAYNPPCAFTSFATCPLPPAQNKLALAVTAGEKKFGEGHH
ncbi:MAG TPA: DUF1684 domain-containing protein [Thermoanaerobaculia bacterium]|nr:DUF1684 domain-containing protein [Thermoanaerobaculia bacterium]